MKKSTLLYSVVAFAFIGLTTQISAYPAQNGQGGKRDVDVMTVNLYVGGDVFQIMTLDPSDPAYPSNLVATVTTVFYEIMSSQPAVRLQGVADEIAARSPDLIALQEVALLRIQSPGDSVIGGTTPAIDVVADYLEMLVSALAARGAHYTVASSVQNLDVELPMMNLQTGGIDDVRYTDRDAILVRKQPPGLLNAKNPQSGNFSVALPIPDMGLSVPRGWCSTDVFARGRQFRFICAHTETQIAPQVQAAQVSELLGGPASTGLPVIIAGDFNTDPLHRDGTTTYDLFVNAGCVDSWNELNPTDPAGGLTWGHDKFLANPGVGFIWRLDLILSQGEGIVPTEVSVIDMELDRTEYPLWASDHAAVLTSFRLEHTR